MDVKLLNLSTRRRLPTTLLPLLAASLFASGAQAQAPPLAAPPLRALIVGGGPDPSYNQVAIENNVLYVNRLLPPGTMKRILFANGRPQTKDVQYTENGHDAYRASRITGLDGASRLGPFHDNLRALSSAGSGPLLLYFTGHGSPGRRDYDTNRYDMWGRDELSVARLATEISAVPKSVPLTLVMVECFSGAFGNLLFEQGSPTGPLVDRPICGFFASLAPRPAAGCTPEIDEANYRDFTSYFFAALSGVDRLGKPVTGADYNHDGVVGMDEAFAYTLIHDDSIDTPVATSDVFLRRYVKNPDTELFRASYADVLSWASPSQAAVLEALSDYLKLAGDDRLPKAYARFSKLDSRTEEPRDVHAIRFIRVAKTVLLAHNLLNSANTTLKERYAALLRAESANPLLPERRAVVER